MAEKKRNAKMAYRSKNANQEKMVKAYECYEKPSGALGLRHKMMTHSDFIKKFGYEPVTKK